ncbi:MAG: hypothetical protein ACRC0L_11740, partial [Angustibacter sp.]
MVNTDAPDGGAHWPWWLGLALTLGVLALAKFRGQLRRLLLAVAVGGLLVSLGTSGVQPVVAAPECGPTSGVVDSDGDGLPDEQEKRFGSDPNLADTDGDGLVDTEELRAITDPRKDDSDGDGRDDAADDTDG